MQHCNRTTGKQVFAQADFELARAARGDYAAVGWFGLVPVSQNLLSLLHLRVRAGEVEFKFPGSARDVNFYGGQAAALHSQMELLVSLAGTVSLETIHG